MRKCWTRCAPWAVHKRGAGVMAGPEVDQDTHKGRAKTPALTLLELTVQVREQTCPLGLKCF